MKFSVRHIKRNSGFTALFAIDTPCVDDSGVAHAIEHLVFRGQGDFHDPNSLFQLTGLLPLKINATTTQHTTYFHCHSPFKELCLLGINFLYQGLTRLKVSEEDMLSEVFNANGGVIHQELAALDGKICFGQGSFSLQQVLQTDNSEHRLSLIGGSQTGIATLTSDDLTRYYQQYYHQCDHQLWCSSEDDNFVQQILEIVDVAPSLRSTVVYQPKATDKCKAIPTDNPPSQEVIEHCWWLGINLSYVNSFHRAIKSRYHAKNIYIFDLPQYPNELGQWPIRILVTDDQRDKISTLSDEISSFTQKYLNTTPQAPSNHFEKYSPDIRELIELHQAQHKQENYKLPPLLSTSKRQLIFNSPQAPSVSIHNHAVANFYNDELLRQITTLTDDLSSTAIHNDGGDSSDEVKKGFTQFHCSPMIAPCLVKSKLDKLEHHVRSHIVGQSLYVERKTLTQQQLSHIVIAAAKDCLGCSPVLPPSLMSLVNIEGDISVHPAVDKGELFNLVYREEEKLDKLLQFTDKNHAIISLSIDKNSVAIAAIVAVVLNCSKVLTRRRLVGQCYAVGARFCNAQQRLIVFSAFDVLPSRFLYFTDQSIKSLADMPDYINDVLMLAKNQVRNDKSLNNTDQHAIERVDLLQIQKLLQTLSNHIQQSISSCNHDELQQQ